MKYEVCSRLTLSLGERTSSTVLTAALRDFIRSAIELLLSKTITTSLGNELAVSLYQDLKTDFSWFDKAM